ncbi:MAG: S8/S53 family peptidase [Micromonosporaceae bacterium]
MARQHDKFWAQFDVVKAAAARHGRRLAVHPLEAESRLDVPPRCVYEKDTLLVTQETANDRAARAHLGFGTPDEDDGWPVKRVPVRSTEDVLAKLAPYGGAATLNHLMSICDVNLCPADEPDPVPADTEPEPWPADSQGGEGVYVRVVDTGLIPGYEEDFSWLAGVQGPPDRHVATFDRRTYGPVATGNVAVAAPPETTILPYYGHGTFIAGLIRRVAPATQVYVSNEFSWAGTVTEQDLGKALYRALAGTPRPDIISLSAGGTTHDDRRHLGLAPFLYELRRSDHTLLVAAAGNEGTERVLAPAVTAPPLRDILSGGDPNPLWSNPVISVGALRTDYRGRACFSNHGPNVTVYAPGERLANAFASGEYRYVDPSSIDCRYCTPALYYPCTCVTAPPRGAQVRFDRMARWSGTSFATPIVAGLIAEHMTKSGESNPRMAAISLLKRKGRRLKNDEYVLLPSSR